MMKLVNYVINMPSCCMRLMSLSSLPPSLSSKSSKANGKSAFCIYAHIDRCVHAQTYSETHSLGVHVSGRKLYIQFPYKWAESYFQLLFLFEANECRLKRCWFHLNKRPQHLRINWQVCPLQSWNRKHNLNIHTSQWAEWISKLLIRPTYFSSSLSCGGLRAWTRASSLLNVKWCNLLYGGVDKLAFSVTVMYPISHDVRRSLFLCLRLCPDTRVEE